MNKILSSVLVIAIGLGATALLANSGGTAGDIQSAQAQLANDGAFRDGVYLGKLAAQSGRSRHVLVGRWSSERDRAAFAAGYERGYENRGE
jgi:hypothetical protein